MRRILARLRASQSGQAFPVVLAALVLAGLIIAPTLNFVSTSLKTGEVLEENVRGLYAAEAGIEDGLWRLRYSPPDFSISDVYGPYTLTDALGNPITINDMTVTVTINVVSSLSGQEIDWEFGVHNKWLLIQHTESWNGTNWDFSVLLTNEGMGDTNIFIDMVLVELDSGFSYAGSPGGNLVVPAPDPTTSGNPDEGGQTVLWVFDAPRPKLDEIGVTRTLSFQVDGPPPPRDKPIGWVAVGARREDVGIVAEYYPAEIIATATNAKGEQARIVAGVWTGSADVIIRKWQIIP